MRHASIKERADTNKFSIGCSTPKLHFFLFCPSAASPISIKDTSFFRLCRVLYRLYVFKNSHKQGEYQISRKESRTALMGWMQGLSWYVSNRLYVGNLFMTALQAYFQINRYAELGFQFSVSWVKIERCPPECSRRPITNWHCFRNGSSICLFLADGAVTAGVRGTYSNQGIGHGQPKMLLSALPANVCYGAFLPGVHDTAVHLHRKKRTGFDSFWFARLCTLRILIIVPTHLYSKFLLSSQSSSHLFHRRFQLLINTFLCQL